MISKSEKAYIRTSLNADPPLRGDGRSLLDYRGIGLELSVAPLANGSARVRIGGDATLDNGGRGISGTEVIVAVKLEVESTSSGGRGRIHSTVSCSPAAYSSLTNMQLDDLQADLTSIVDATYGDPSVLPTNLVVIPGRKAWLVHLDALVLADDGNVIDALFMASSAALRDTRVPRTKPIEFRAAASSSNDVKQDEDVPMAGPSSGLDTRALPGATDFELLDYWDDGEPPQCPRSASWPVCITLNLVPPIHYLDATGVEEEATLNRLVVTFSFVDQVARLQGTRLLGHGEVDASEIKGLIREGEMYARQLSTSLDIKLRNELQKRNPHLLSKGKQK